MSPRLLEGGVGWPQVALKSPWSQEKGVGRWGEAPGLIPRRVSRSSSREAPSRAGCVRLRQALGQLLDSAFVRAPGPQAERKCTGLVASQ